MKRSHFVGFHLVLVLTLGVFGAAGCDDKSDAGGAGSAAGSGTAGAASKSGGKSSANVLGTYENANDKVTIELKAGGKATMIDEEKSTDVTWEMDGADKLVIHGQEGMNMVFRINSDGNLADDMGLGSVFRKK